MKKRISQLLNYLRRHQIAMLWFGLASILIFGLLSFRLGSLVPGLSPVEQTTSQATYGWHGLFSQPLWLPLNLMRSVAFVLSSHHGALILRAPNVLLGAITIFLFALLIKHWHGNRTALLSTILFACSAWLLHISRLASTDVLYLLALPLLLIIQLGMHKAVNRPVVFYGSLAISGLLLYVPGLIWCVMLSLFWQRKAIKQGWQRFSKIWQRTLYVLAGLVWLPLLILRLMDGAKLHNWLGLPEHIVIKELLRQLIFVPVHLFGRGPNDPQRWLGHAPVLDLFTLVVTLAGILFYLKHYRATRSRVIGSYALLGSLLVGLGGSVSISLLLPLVYVLAATGIAYFIHEWLAVFPRNPVARNLGIGIIAVAITVSCTYNLRAYFVAWPHNPQTLASFNQKT